MVNPNVLPISPPKEFLTELKEEAMSDSGSEADDNKMNELDLFEAEEGGPYNIVDHHINDEEMKEEIPSISPTPLEVDQMLPVRERSPLRHLPRSPHQSPSPWQGDDDDKTVVVKLIIEESLMNVQPNGNADAREASEEIVGEQAVGRSGSRGLGGRDRRGSRTRGSRGRGEKRGRGRPTVNAVGGKKDWQRGQRVFEVCVNDEDVSHPLQNMVRDLEMERARSAKGRSRNVRVDSDSEDELPHNAETFTANELFAGDRAAMEFEWSPMDTFSGLPEEFLPKNPGPTVNVLSAYEAFRTYWNDEILNHIVRETNRYATELKTTSARYAREWYDTNVHEVMVLFAFWMMLGIIPMPSIKSCFSNSYLLKTSIFRTMMTEARYWILNKSLHFVDNAKRTENSSELFNLGPVADHLNSNFKEAYVPAQDILIDQSLTLWKGDLSFKQYNKSKTGRLGIETFELCESITGYMWSFVIYTGKATDPPSLMSKSMEMVVELIRPLLNKGHKLFMDNWFNSPVLARFLKRNKTDCIGTLRKNQKNVPAIMQIAKLPQGAFIARHSGDVVVMVYRDKRPVYTISTCHGTESSLEDKGGKESHYKPTVITDYNRSMCGVDRKDQMLEPYLIERKKNREWYKKIFKRLLNVSINNSRVLLDKSKKEQVEQLAFRLELVDAILKAHLQFLPKMRHQHPTQNADLPAERLVSGNHFITRSNVSNGEDRRTGPTYHSKGSISCLWCTVRERKRSRTVYRCEHCQVPLCLEGCFKKFHTIS